MRITSISGGMRELVELKKCGNCGNCNTFSLFIYFTWTRLDSIAGWPQEPIPRSERSEIHSTLNKKTKVDTFI